MQKDTEEKVKPVQVNDYSDVEKTLTDLQQVIDFTERSKLSNDSMSLTDKSILDSKNNEIMYSKLQQLLRSEDHNMIRTTSLALFKQFIRFFKTND